MPTTDNQLLTTESLALLQRAEQGVIPADLATCTTLLRACAKLDRAMLAVRWMTLATARDCPEFAHDSTTGRGNESPWLAWVMAEYQDYANKSNIHHMARVGEFLLRALRAGHKVCGDHTLYDLPFDTLLALSRLPDHLLGPILEKYDLAAMERGKVRRLVANCLKSNGLPTEGLEEDAKPKAPSLSRGGAKPEQLDFLDTLFSQAVDVFDGKQRQELLASKRVQPRVAAINGLYALGIAAAKWTVAATVDESDLEETIDELDKLRTELVDRLANRGPRELEE